MNVRNKPPVFVPKSLRPDLEKLSKAALMDMVWDLGVRCATNGALNADNVCKEIKDTADLIQQYRSQQ